MKTAFKIFGTLALLLIMGAFALFNTEIFYSEYWLQEKLNKYSCIEPLTDIQLGNKELTYQFYLDGEVDIEIKIDDNGYIFLGTKKWFKNGKGKGYYFQIDSLRTKGLIEDYLTLESKLESKSSDYHLGGHYYKLKFIDKEKPDKILEIGYYNYQPGEKFENFKDKLVEIGYEVLEEF